MPELITDGIKYALCIGRRQPMTTAHVAAIQEVVDAGLRPIILVGSTNNLRSHLYDPLSNPLTFAQQCEQIKRSLPSLKDPVIIPFEDLGDSERWAKALANILDDPFRLRLAGLNVDSSIKAQTVVHYLQKPIPSASDIYDQALEHNNIRFWRSDIIKDDVVATPDFIKEQCLSARNSNPDRKILDDAGIALSLLDISLMRIYNETGTTTSNLLKVTGQNLSEEGLKGAMRTFISHNQIIQQSKNPVTLNQYLNHASEHYNPDGNPVMEFLFHPATLLAIQSLGPAILDKLIPQGGFEHFIPEMRGYNERMAKSMEDKIDYLREIEKARIVVDFGCANGAMLKYLHSIDSSKHYIGYDISQPMIDLANTDNPGGITFTTNWQDVIEETKRVAKEKGTESVLVLSSLIHEVYSYVPKDEIKDFWHKVWNSDFDYVAIRDMMVSESIDRPSKQEDVQRIRDNYDSHKIDEWEKQWGPLENNRSMVHFLLTCPYKENWVREMHEDYLPVSMQEFIKNIPDNYQLKLFEHYTLPYFSGRTRDEFGLEVGDNTHMKIVLKKADPLEEQVKTNKRCLLDKINEVAPGTEISGRLEAEQFIFRER